VTAADRSLSGAMPALRAAFGDRVRASYPLAPLTSFRIGGPADAYLEPESVDDLEALARVIADTGVPIVVIGKGSNILVADAGFHGVVIRLGRGFRWSARDRAGLSAGGAMPLPALAGVALSHALEGLEFGVAIPASLGGAVRMNAGAHGSEMAEVVSSIDVFDLGSADASRRSAGDAGFRYRGSGLAAEQIVIGASFALRDAPRDEIRARMDEARTWRRRTQPIAEPNCGSVFLNPPGHHAANLIEAVGGKELRVGRAAISAKHANFIVAGPGCRAADVAELIDRVTRAVAARFDVHMETEVRLVGDFARAST
jgi:UDP-N-acetylmuramate dehydrogenase